MIVLGCDPSGSLDPTKRNSGFVVLDCGRATPVVLARRDCGIDDLDAVTLWLIREYRPTIVGIDQPREVFLHGKSAASPQAHTRIVRDVIATARAGGHVGGIAIAEGCRVFEGTAKDWRAGIVGNEKAEDAETARVIRLLIPGWDAFVGPNNAHVRDAAAVALWAHRRARLPVEMVAQKKRRRAAA